MKKVKNQRFQIFLSFISKITAYIIKHWKGEFPLVTSYWVNGILVSFLIIAIGYIVIPNSEDFDQSYKIASIISIVYFITLIGLETWLTVGIWRSANNYIKTLKKRKLINWGRAAQMYALLGMLTICKESIPSITEYWKIYTDADGEYQVRILRNASELEFSGPITFGATDYIKKLLISHPSIELIHLNSYGGRVTEAQKLAALIEERGLSTYTSTGCHSACTIPFVAGKERLTNYKAGLGFHKYSFPGLDEDEVDYSLYKTYFLNKGITNEFVEKIFTVPNDQMWKPTYEELLKSRVITGNPDINQVSVSGVKADDLQKVEEYLLKLPLYNALKETDTNSYNVILETIKSGLERGKSLAEIRAITMPILAKLYKERLPYSSDSTILSFARLFVAQLEVLNKINPIICYNYVTYAPENIEVTQYLSKELLNAEMEIMANVLTTYDKNMQIPSESTIEQDLSAIITNLSQTHEKDTLLLFNNPNNQTEKLKICSITIDMYKHILGLPYERSSNMLRYMFGHQE